LALMEALRESNETLRQRWYFVPLHAVPATTSRFRFKPEQLAKGMLTN